MIVEGRCRTCRQNYDAHWHNYPEEVKNVLNPYCLYCKSENVWTETDESIYDYVYDSSDLESED